MGTLKPGVTYTYEHVDGITYAREMGALPSERFPIGWDYDSKAELQKYHDDRLWKNVLVEAETNPALQDALDTFLSPLGHAFQKSSNLSDLPLYMVLGSWFMVG